MPDQFVRFQAVGIESLGAGKYAGHKRCQTRSEHTKEGPRAGIKPVSLVNELEFLEAALTAIDRDARGRRGEQGRRPSGCYDVLMTGAPRYDGQTGEPLSEEDELRWASACVVWLRSVLPRGTIIANASLHRDEASPHVHVTVVPWCEETRSVDWRTCRARMAGVEPRPRPSFEGLMGKNHADGRAKTEEELEADKLQVRKIRGADKRAAGKEMSGILDSFHSQVSEPFGIGRGDKGNRRRHRKVDRRKALELEEKGARAKVAQVELEERVARERLQMAKTEADMLEEELVAREDAVLEREENISSVAGAAYARGEKYGRSEGLREGKESGFVEGQIYERRTLLDMITSWCATASAAAGAAVMGMLREVTEKRGKERERGPGVIRE